jgi:hypothetical protein
MEDRPDGEVAFEVLERLPPPLSPLDSRGEGDHG